MKLSKLKILIDKVLEKEDKEVNVSLDVSTGEKDFDHRMFGDILELVNQNSNYCFVCELTEDNYKGD